MTLLLIVRTPELQQLAAAPDGLFQGLVPSDAEPQTSSASQGATLPARNKAPASASIPRRVSNARNPRVDDLPNLTVGRFGQQVPPVPEAPPNVDDPFDEDEPFIRIVKADGTLYGRQYLRGDLSGP